MKAARTRALNKKHAGTTKHASTAKHTGSATRKGATAHKQVARRAAAQVKAAHLRAWSPDGTVALCSARAFAESLRIATGRAVSHAELLDVYWHAALSADAGASILATYAAISATGLGGYYPQLRAPCLSRDCDCVHILGTDDPEPHAVAAAGGTWWSWGEPFEPWTDDVDEAWAVMWS